jgi:hypothetical protein
MWNDTNEKWATTVKRRNAVAVVCPFLASARGEWIVARYGYINPPPGRYKAPRDLLHLLRDINLWNL